ncbi:MAG: hypothetical protein GY797_34810 [Deltaproteobacteria bacterium]|nr:hypothetical protein [Deltaproteobacteria bacterium]
MRYPHVVSLQYRLETTDTVTFDKPESIKVEVDSFQLRLENNSLIVELSEHFASAEDARNAVESLLRAWEIDAALRYGKQEIFFVYEDAKIIDRDPLPQGSPQTVQLSTLGMVGAIGDLSVHVTRRTYPEPPSLFRSSPDVEVLWQRFNGYLEGREPLLSMAYFCLTVIEASTGVRRNKRQQAVQDYNIHLDVLNKLGELTSSRGDPKIARKFISGDILAPLSSKEVIWIETAIKVIIRRVGENLSTDSLPVITLKDLPELQ